MTTEIQGPYARCGLYKPNDKDVSNSDYCQGNYLPLTQTNNSVTWKCSHCGHEVK